MPKGQQRPDGLRLCAGGAPILPVPIVGAPSSLAELAASHGHGHLAELLSTYAEHSRQHGLPMRWKRQLHSVASPRQREVVVAVLLCLRRAGITTVPIFVVLEFVPLMGPDAALSLG